MLNVSDRVMVTQSSGKTATRKHETKRNTKIKANKKYNVAVFWVSSSSVFP
jgi:hypothetical protein